MHVLQPVKPLSIPCHTTIGWLVTAATGPATILLLSRATQLCHSRYFDNPPPIAVTYVYTACHLDEQREDKRRAELPNNDRSSFSSAYTRSAPNPPSSCRRRACQLDFESNHPQTPNPLLQYRRACRHSRRRPRFEAVWVLSHTQLSRSLQNTVKRDTRSRG